MGPGARRGRTDRASSTGAAEAIAADHVVAATTSSAALRPRTIQGRITEPAAHKVAPSSTPRLSIGSTTWTAALGSEPSQTARAGVPGGSPSHSRRASSGSARVSHQ